MTDFYDTDVFDIRPDWGFESAPTFNVTINRRSSGFETRNRNWARPLHRYTVTIGAGNGRDEADIDAVLEWFMAMGGPECGFRIRDWTDYKSCGIHETPTAVDQGTIQRTTTKYQLQKSYIKGARVQVREVYKPENSADFPLLIAVGGTPTPSGWTLDATTGIVTFDSAPGGAVTWGGAFYVPVRFTSQDLPKQALMYQTQGVSFNLEELRLPTPSVA